MVLPVLLMTEKKFMKRTFLLKHKDLLFDNPNNKTKLIRIILMIFLFLMKIINMNYYILKNI